MQLSSTLTWLVDAASADLQSIVIHDPAATRLLPPLLNFKGYVGLQAWRLHLRTWLLASTALMAATGLGFAFVADFWPLLLIAMVGAT